MLRSIDIGYTELNGKVPVKKRGKIIEKFETQDNCRVFLSTEAGGAGLNLQMADTVINFELPWNPAKKNQRIRRIDRLGQKSAKLSVINLVTRNSIETKIATGQILKQNLFEGVMDADNQTDIVDFSAKGKSQFLSQMEEMISEFDYEIFPNETDIEKIEETEGTVLDNINRDKSTSEQNSSISNEEKQLDKHEQMELVMNKGLEFLAGLYKMSTGEELANKSQKVEIDKETGEIEMRFKLNI